MTREEIQAEIERINKQLFWAEYSTECPAEDPTCIDLQKRLSILKKMLEERK